MEMNSHALRARALRAYEWGRIRAALRDTLPVIPLIGGSLLACAAPAHTIASGCLLYAVAVGLRWKGGAFARAVTPGFVAGLGAFFAPLLAGALWADPACDGLALRAVCFVGGFATGGFVGLSALRATTDEASFLRSAAVIAGLTGSLGCLFSGLGGILGMVLGLFVATAPVFVLIRVRA